MNEYKITVMNRLEPERIVVALAELIANRDGCTVKELEVSRT